MGRPRCDPFDAAAIIAAIGKGETTPLRAYQAYASTAARPYARSTFEIYLRGHERLGPLGVSRTGARESSGGDRSPLVRAAPGPAIDSRGAVPCFA